MALTGWRQGRLPINPHPTDKGTAAPERLAGRFGLALLIYSLDIHEDLWITGVVLMLWGWRDKCIPSNGMEARAVFPCHIISSWIIL